MSKIFSCACFFTEKKIQPAAPTPSPAPLSDLPVAPLHPKQIHESGHKNEQQYQPPAYVVYDDALEQLRQSAREFVQVTIDVVHEQQLLPYIVAAQEVSPSIPPAVKSVTKLLIEMGDKAAKPLFQKLASQKAETIDPTLKKILNMLLRVDNVEFRTQLFEHLQKEISASDLPKGQKHLDYLKPVMDWICSTDQHKQPVSILLTYNDHLDGVLINELCAKAQDFYHSYRLMDLSQLYDSLEERLAKELKDAHIPIDQDLSKHYIKPILDWLLRSDQSEPIASLFTPKTRYADDLIDRTFELAITYIVEHNIDQFANRLDNILQNQLQTIVYDTIQANAQNITDFLTERVSELVTAMPFTETFDSIIKDVVAEHIDACTVAQDAAAQSITPEAAYLKKFSQHKSCSSFAKQIINQQQFLSSEGKDPANVRKAIEKAFFAHLTEKLFGLMFPLKKKLTSDGSIEEIDPFIELWQRLSFPKELHSLAHKIEEITQEFVTLDTRSLFSNIKQPALEIVRNIFKTAAQDIFKRQFISMLQNVFEKLTLPEEVAVLMAETVLPAINKQIVSVTISQEVSQSAPALMPYFHALIKEDLQSRESNIEAIQKTLIPLVEKRFQEFSTAKYHLAETEAEGNTVLTYKPLSRAEWYDLTQAIIENTEQLLLKELRKDPLFPTSMPSEAELLTLYRKQQQTAPPAPTPLYGEIVANLIFKLGEWPEYVGVGSFVKNLASSKTTVSIEEIRASHHYLTAHIAEIISHSFANKERIFNLLYAPPASPSVHTKEKLDHQIDILARLSHDLMMGNIEGQYAIIKYAVKKYVKNDSSAINALISDVYKKLFNRHTVNESLLMNFCDRFFKGLQEADEAIKQQQQLTLHLQ